MANEKRLIDFEVAKRATYEELFWTESEQAVVRHFLAKLPKVDAVEVVRCEKCKFAVGHDGIHKTVKCQKRSAYPQQWDDMPFDGFCSNGERREGE